MPIGFVGATFQLQLHCCACNTIHGATIVGTRMSLLPNLIIVFRRSDIPVATGISTFVMAFSELRSSGQGCLSYRI